MCGSDARPHLAAGPAEPLAPHLCGRVGWALPHHWGHRCMAQLLEALGFERMVTHAIGVMHGCPARSCWRSWTLLKPILGDGYAHASP